MAIKFYIQSNDYGILQIPVNPPSIQVNKASNNRVVNVIGLGDVTVLRNPRLDEVNFECFFPKSDGIYTGKSYIATPFLLGEPNTYIRNIHNLMEQRKVVKFVVSDLAINMLVTIEKFEYVPEAGDDDIKYVMSLKKYVPHAVKPATIDGEGNVIIQKDLRSDIDFSNKKNLQSGALAVVNGMIYKDDAMSSPLGVFNGAISVIGVTDIMGDDKKYQILNADGKHVGWAEEQALSAINSQIRML